MLAPFIHHFIPKRQNQWNSGTYFHRRGVNRDGHDRAHGSE